MRTLRAVIRNTVEHALVDVFSNVGDRRTLRALLERVGIEPHGPLPTVPQFFARQQFVLSQNAGCQALRDLARYFRAPVDRASPIASFKASGAWLKPPDPPRTPSQTA